MEPQNVAGRVLYQYGMPRRRTAAYITLPAADETVKTPGTPKAPCHKHENLAATGGVPPSPRPETPDRNGESVRKSPGLSRESLSQESSGEAASSDFHEPQHQQHPQNFSKDSLPEDHGTLHPNPLEMKKSIDNLRRETKGWENWLIKLQDIAFRVDNVWQSEEVLKRIRHCMLKPYPIECHCHVCHHDQRGSKSRPWNYAAGQSAKGTDVRQCFYSDRPDRLDMANNINILNDIQAMLKSQEFAGQSLKSIRYQALSAIESMVMWRRPDNCERSDAPRELTERARKKAMRLAEHVEALGLHIDIKDAAGESPGSVTQQVDSHMVRKALQVLDNLRRHCPTEVMDGSHVRPSNASYLSLLRASLQNIHTDMSEMLQQMPQGRDTQDTPGCAESEAAGLTECCRRIRLFCMSGDQEGRAQEAHNIGLLPLISKAMKEHRGSHVLQYEACFAFWVLGSHDKQGDVVKAIEELELHQDIHNAVRFHGRCKMPNVLRVALQALTPSLESRSEHQGIVLNTFRDLMQDNLWSQEHQCQAYRMLCELFRGNKLIDAYKAASDYIPIIQQGMQEHIKSSQLQLEASKAVHAMASSSNSGVARLLLEPYKIYHDLEKASTRHCNKPRLMSEIVRTMDLLDGTLVRKDTKDELREKAATIRAHQVRGIRKLQMRSGI